MRVNHLSMSLRCASALVLLSPVVVYSKKTGTPPPPSSLFEQVEDILTEAWASIDGLAAQALCTLGLGNEANTMANLALIVAVTVVLTLLLNSGKNKIVSSVALRQWEAAGDVISHFAEQLGVKQEIDLPGFTHPMPLDLALLSACQQLNDPRAASTISKTDAFATKLHDGAHFMKFASAAYGTSAMVKDGRERT